MESKKAILVRLWNQGQSLDGIVASLKLAGITKRSGVEISKKYVKLKIREYIANGSVKKRPVTTEKKAS